MLIKTFIPFTTKSVSIGLTLSCIPINQPLNAMSPKVAGAAHILTKKYMDANSLTWSVQSTTANAIETKTHCTAISSKAQARAIPAARKKIRAHSLMSPRPYAWAASPPVPTLRKLKFQ